MVGSLEELASRSDFVSMHTPLNDETRHLAGEAFFKAMKPSAFFINTSRGGTVDERALIDALRNGEIAGARSPRRRRRDNVITPTRRRRQPAVPMA